MCEVRIMVNNMESRRRAITKVSRLCWMVENVDYKLWVFEGWSLVVLIKIDGNFWGWKSKFNGRKKFELKI